MKDKLTALKLKTAADGKHFDGGGLALVKTGSTGKWVFRFSHLGKRREMGLGNWPTVTLAEARKMRDAWAVKLAAGSDPISAREAQRAAEAAERDKKDPTFAELTDTVFDAIRDSLKGDGRAGRWRSPLDTHIIPAIGKKRVSDVTRIEIAAALKPIWRKKHPTAVKAFNRTRKILNEGKLMGFPCDGFEAEAARRILGDVHHVEVAIPSTPWQDLPDLYARLGDTPIDLCLRFMILTLVRMDGCQGVTRREIADGVWTVPAERVKGRKRTTKDFRVPLSAEALAVAELASEGATTFLFETGPGRRPSNSGIENRLTALGEVGRPHGFRTSFRTWVQDTDACSWEVSETILNHIIGGKTERAYARSDLLDRRRPVMEAWAAFVTGKAAQNVLQLGSSRKSG
ncbi:tyrosine-type recombinase/integrase [Paracoccus sp. KR1-242]|uniref:tyrosine-type recombinase/integrase n=1 Tax=Paracoccus sp. KR1-242 TaxID=3410028 RepID=UPI003BFBF9F7